MQAAARMNGESEITTVSPRHVMIVDDNRLIRVLLTEALEGCGNRVTAAAGGTEMRNLLERDHVDVVVLDIFMPGEDGHSLAFLAKDLRLPVVLISGNDNEINFAQKHGLQLLRKPFCIAQLLDALDTASACNIYGQRDA